MEEKLQELCGCFARDSRELLFRSLQPQTNSKERRERNELRNTPVVITPFFESGIERQPFPDFFCNYVSIRSEMTLKETKQCARFIFWNSYSASAFEAFTCYPSEKFRFC
ncbi:hypothetical protein TNCT_686281 [Trichonephila clavata]|uniref:Uncharacterized protein n=1 Tax=Trichonephila clavata TaxID=2740835 RepID=A0A8X6LWG4_TRICU|nr:hypothetical protein TNCT_686281 [Trichonephila clavata]